MAWRASDIGPIFWRWPWTADGHWLSVRMSKLVPLRLFRLIRSQSSEPIRRCANH